VLQHLLFFAKPDVYWFAIPNAGRRTMRMGARMVAEGLTRGVADLCIMLHEGRTGWMECKTAVGRQRPDQKFFQERCEALGHRYAMVRSVEEATEVLREWGALR